MEVQWIYIIDFTCWSRQGNQPKKVQQKADQVWLIVMHAWISTNPLRDLGSYHSKMDHLLLHGTVVLSELLFSWHIPCKFVVKISAVDNTNKARTENSLILRRPRVWTITTKWCVNQSEQKANQQKGLTRTRAHAMHDHRFQILLCLKKKTAYEQNPRRIQGW